MVSQSPGEEIFRLGTLEISKGNYANSEKINDLIEWDRELEENKVDRKEFDELKKVVEKLLLGEK